MKIKFTFTPDPAAKVNKLSVTLGSIDYDIELFWMDVSRLWVASISRNGKSVTQGRVVVNNQDLLGNIHDIGKLTFEGEKPDAYNIGSECFMYYYEVKQ
ncbi:phage baseplate plug family protein [Vibrio harveyi]|uniref:phage baseplate plug family protein n=1 Tax=Vibrio harveyi TaxID=669 RepID=UPI003CF43A9A